MNDSRNREVSCSSPVELRVKGFKKSADQVKGLLPRKIFIDCTATYFSGLNTGIQRVVRNIVERADELSEDFGIPVIPVVSVSEQFKPLEEIRNQPPGQLPASTHYRKVVKAFLERKGAFGQPVLRTAKFLLAVARYCMPVGRRISSRLRRTVVRPRRDGLITRQDLLVLLDAFWIYDALEAAEKLALDKPVTVTVIYDLIPIINPECCEELHVTRFRALLERVIKISDGLIGISKTVRQTLESFIGDHYADREPMALDYFYLGADFQKSPTASSLTIPEEVEALFAAEDVPFFLAVGTIEPRKGYDYLLEAFELLWREGKPNPLVIVGKIGWLYEEVLGKAKLLQEENHPLIMLHGVDDATLSALYNRCAALIFASKNEGFGLPLIEAQLLEKPVLASRIAIFEEIGGEQTSYFTVGSASDLKRCVTEFLDRREVHPKPPLQRGLAVTWDDSATALLEKSLAMYALKRSV